MKKLLLPLVFAIAGTGAGVGAAMFLQPSVEPEDAIKMSGDPCGDTSTVETKTANADPITTPDPTEFAKLNNQFVVPVVDIDRIAAMVVVSLSIEVPEGNTQSVYDAEPRLRDKFLQVMFDHANIGGFSGNFTSSTNMRILRQELLRGARSVIGDNAYDVLILDIVRQDT